MGMEDRFLEIYKLKPAEFRALDRDRTCVVIPIAPIEYHGDHLPLGTDYVNSRDSFRSGCERFSGSNPDWKFLFMPVIPVGCDAVPHGGTIWVSPRLIRDLAEEVSRRFLDYGFRYIAIYSGHGGYRQMGAFEEVARIHNLKYARKKARVFAPLTYMFTKVASREFVDNLNSYLAEPITDEDIRQMVYETHGGRFETSYMLHAAPELMDESYKTARDVLPEPHLIVKALIENVMPLIPGVKDLQKGAEALAVAMTWFYGGCENGYLGYPSRASAEFGHAFAGAMSGIFAELLEEVLIGDKIPSDGLELLAALRLFAH
jgi:creatinine amidohydrolase